MAPVQASVTANSASGLGGSNLASTSTDNTVTFQGTPPDGHHQSGSRSERSGYYPANQFHSCFQSRTSTGSAAAAFRSPVQPANVSAASINISGSGTTYNVAVGNIQSAGTVQASVLANAATGFGGGNQAFDQQ